MSGNCGLTFVCAYLSVVLLQSANTLRQRLREVYKPAEKKRGRQRRSFEVAEYFAALLAWIVRLMNCDHVSLALDATSLSDRFVVLSISVVYRSMAIPVA